MRLVFQRPAWPQEAAAPLWVRCCVYLKGNTRFQRTQGLQVVSTPVLPAGKNRKLSARCENAVDLQKLEKGVCDEQF